MQLGARWGGGLEYSNQKRVFSAILRFGWENVKHYMLFDGLEENEAKLIEAALIRDWKTTMRGKGYNSVQPKVEGLDMFVVPKFTKTEVYDTRNEDINERYAKRIKRSGRSKKCKKVRLIETGEVFVSATEAAREMFVTPSAISRAALNSHATCGTCWIEDEDEGWRMEVPAHWEYINKNTEEKE